MPLIHGQDPSGYLKPLLVDASGNIILSQPVQVKGTNSDKLLSISDSLLTLQGTATLAAGNNTFTLFTCPAGMMYHFGLFTLYYAGTVTNVSLQLYLTRSAVNYIIYAIYSITTGRWNPVVLDFFMKPGDILVFQVTNATLNDDAYCNALGYSLHTT